MTLPLSSPVLLLGVLLGLTALLSALEQRRALPLFRWMPAIIFIYLLPMALTTAGITPSAASLYGAFDRWVLPMVLPLLLITLPLRSVLGGLTRSAAVMLIGSAGVVLGSVISFMILGRSLGDGAWKAYGAIAGSWTGGTANMAAAATALEIAPGWYGLAILADSVLFMIWLPFLLFTARRSPSFATVPAKAPQGPGGSAPEPATGWLHGLGILAVGLAVPWLAARAAVWIPAAPPVLTPATLRILLVTTLALGLSFTPLVRLRGTRPVAMALLYLFVASMGARADLSPVAGHAPLFLAAAALTLVIHGLTVFAGARLLGTDAATGAIGSAANVGGVASAVLVASHHDPRRVPSAVLLALLGFALGNYLALLTAHLCRLLT